MKNVTSRTIEPGALATSGPQPQRPRELHWRNPWSWVFALLIARFIFVGMRAVFAPEAAAGAYGVPLLTGQAASYVQAFGARNLAICLLACSLLWADQRRWLGILLLCASPIALVDAWAVYQQIGISRDVVRHLVTATVLGAVGLWAMRARAA